LYSNLAANRYTWNSFSWEARNLILALLVYQEGLDHAEVIARIDDGTLPVPDPVKRLIQHKVIWSDQPRPGAVERMLLRLRQALFKVDLPPDTQLDQQVEAIVGFIEHRLEITYVGNQRKS
jgi:hypothetical protein